MQKNCVVHTTPVEGPMQEKKVTTVSTVITGNVKNIDFDAKFPSHCVKFCLGQAEQCKARQG